MLKSFSVVVFAEKWKPVSLSVSFHISSWRCFKHQQTTTCCMLSLCSVRVSRIFLRFFEILSTEGWLLLRSSSTTSPMVIPAWSNVSMMNKIGFDWGSYIFTEKISGCRENRCYKIAKTGICSQSALLMDSFMKDSGSTRLDKVLWHFVTRYLLRKWSLVTEITESNVRKSWNPLQQVVTQCNTNQPSSKNHWSSCVWTKAMGIPMGYNRCHVLHNNRDLLHCWHGNCQGTLFELSTWYSTLVLLSRSYLITCPHLPYHPGLSLYDPIPCSIVF